MGSWARWAVIAVVTRGLGAGVWAILRTEGGGLAIGAVTAALLAVLSAASLLAVRSAGGAHRETRRAGYEGLPPIAPPSSAYDRLVYWAFADLVQSGRLLFNPPERMELGDTKRVEVRL